MPFKLNQDRRHHIPKQRHKVTNWREYDASSHGALLRQAGKSSAHWKISGFSVQTVSRVEPVSVLAVRTRTTSHSAGAHGSRTTIPLTAGRGSGGRDHSYEAALEAMLAFGSPTWIRQDLIRVLPNEDAMI